MKNKRTVTFLMLMAMIPGLVFAAPDTDSSHPLIPKANQAAAQAPDSAKTEHQFAKPGIPGAGGAKTSSSSSRPTQPAVGSSKNLELSPDYKILVGDQLDIKIYPEDQYIKGGAMQVSSEGSITLPLVGKFKIEGKTVAEAEQELVKIIDADYLVNPEVVVQITQSILKTEEKKRKAIALGQVRKPGSYEFPPEKEAITLLELISLAGGFTEVANIKKIKIIRKLEGKKDVQSVNGEAIISGDSPDIELKDGDIINVAESVF